ncbi:hypothetical protein ACF8Q9_19720 [Pseudomonas sp. TYF_15]|uniref:hypothetical protein n=1 Tax=Pseudomonas sp. TYF_15 TaxID=3367194 RepID=UPI00370C2EE8
MVLIAGFNSASVQDIVNNKSCRNCPSEPGGKHGTFSVSIASKAKEFGFTAKEIKGATVPTRYVTFVGVTDKHGSPVPDDLHHDSRAGRLLHNNLIKELNGAQSKAQALSVIDSDHSKSMKPGAC